MSKTELAAENRKTAEPVAAPSAAREGAAEKGAGFSNAEKPIILVVDDRPEILTAIAGMLMRRFNVLAATSGRAALRIIQKHSPALFLLDMEMPQMNGYELSNAIRKQTQFERTPIIFLIGQTSRPDIALAITRSGGDYLVKPLDEDALLCKIQHYLGSV